MKTTLRNYTGENGDFLGLIDPENPNGCTIRSDILSERIVETPPAMGEFLLDGAYDGSVHIG